MQIKLKKLTLTNFKGIPHLEINFNCITNIYGENAAGKTTIFDAFTWLCFDKDSTNRTVFGLKPIGKDGKVSQKVDVEVSAIIEADGKTIELRKVLHEKWVKKRGEKDVTFEGNENLFYWNDVPLQLKQYNEKIADLVNEHVFKLITNPLYFNSLKWQDRREVLLQIAGEIDNEDLLKSNPDFSSIISILEDKTIEEYKKELAAKKKKLKDELTAIPTRIDEINRNMPEKVDFSAIKKAIASKEKEISEIESSLEDASKLMQSAFDAKRKQQNDLHELKTKADNIKRDIKSRFIDQNNKRKEEISELRSNMRLKEAELRSIESQEQSLRTDIESANSDLATLRDQWANENNRKLEFNEDEFVCPACKRGLDQDHVHSTKETLTANFNTDKARRLADIVSRAEKVKSLILSHEKQLEQMPKTNVLADTIAALKEELDTAEKAQEEWLANSEQKFNEELSFDVEYNKVLFRIEEMEKSVLEEVKVDDSASAGLKGKKQVIKAELDALNRQLNDEETIKRSIQRRTELEKQESEFAQQLADIEGSEYLAAQFNRAKMDMLVERINSRFKYVTFKMFNFTIDGGEIPTCETLVNGVPFSDANNAARINAGIDIIRTLCEHYNVYAPIFIDNRESVTELIDCESQIINLIVSPSDKKLRIA